MAWVYEPHPAPPAPAPRAQGGAIEEMADERANYDDPAPRPRARPMLMLQWPLPATGVTSLYGQRRDPLDGSSRHHQGVDLEAEYGQVVEAAAAGYVVFAGWSGGHGRQVIVEHAGGYITSYSHLSQTLVSEDTYVKAGQAVGRVGNSGRSTGPHLHLEVSRNGATLDPLDLLGVPLVLDP